MSTPEAPTALVLPPGATVGPARETSQQNAQGQVVQGMLFPVTLITGASTNIFVPYSVIGNLTVVQALFDQRINAINAITGG